MRKLELKTEGREMNSACNGLSRIEVGPEVVMLVAQNYDAAKDAACDELRRDQGGKGSWTVFDFNITFGSC